MSLRERLRSRQLPRETVSLPGAADGGEQEQFELHAIPPGEWEALVALHPPTEAQSARGDQWDISTFRPALLAASVVPPTGEDGLTEADWADAAVQGWLTIGELNVLLGVAISLNDRSPLVSVGKG